MATAMSDPEDILARWSRRKAAARASPQPTEAPAPDNAPSDGTAAAAAETPPPFDLASLPSIESIGAETDLRVFLAKGVPADLTRAALRRAWSADPAIRDFIGLSENSWDFNDPGAMDGFGSLEPEQVRKILAQMLDAARTPEAPVQPRDPFPDEKKDIGTDGNSGAPQKMPVTTAAAPHGLGASTRSETAKSETPAQPESDDTTPPRRRHGGATPRLPPHR
jgi:uncharacterized protein DUF3306